MIAQFIGLRDFNIEDYNSHCNRHSDILEDGKGSF